MLGVISYILMALIAGIIFTMVLIARRGHNELNNEDVINIGVITLVWPITLSILIFGLFPLILGKTVTIIVNKIIGKWANIMRR